MKFQILSLCSSVPSCVGVMRNNCMRALSIHRCDAVAAVVSPTISILPPSHSPLQRRCPLNYHPLACWGQYRQHSRPIQPLSLMRSITSSSSPFSNPLLIPPKTLMTLNLAAAHMQNTLRSHSTSPSAPKARKRGGYQTEVLAVYKKLLREAGRKENPEGRQQLKLHIRQQFEHHGKRLKRTDIDSITYWLGYAKRQLEMLESSKPSDSFNIR